MKKLCKIVLVLSVIVVILLCGCSSATTKRFGQISELRDELLCGSSESVTVEIISGIHENPFEIDGKCNPKRNFTVITVTGENLLGVVNYRFTHDGKSYDGALDKHPLKNSYSTELNIRVYNELLITITAENVNVYIRAKTVRDEKTISADRALEVAQIRLADKFKQYDKKAEIYLRYIKNPISTAQGYYWYVAIVPDRYTVFAVLVDSHSGEVVAVRE